MTSQKPALIGWKCYVHVQAILTSQFTEVAVICKLFPAVEPI